VKSEQTYTELNCADSGLLGLLLHPEAGGSTVLLNIGELLRDVTCKSTGRLRRLQRDAEGRTIWQHPELNPRQ
jgi:hypothetical protein